MNTKELRSRAQSINVKLHIGKNGITDATIAELARHLKQDKLVKVRLLPGATEGGVQDRPQAEALAQATQSTLVEVRGHTAVYWKA